MIPWIVILGPTGVGKTWLAIELARRFPLEMINADSRQSIRGLHVGTATPKAAELQGIASHLFEIRSAADSYTLFDWLGDARQVIQEVEARGNVPLIVGGTGLHLRALLEGFELLSIPPDQERRRETFEKLSISELANELLMRDPKAAEKIDVDNPRRVTRALELLEAGSGLVAQRRPPSRRIVKLGMDVERAAYRRLIEQRSAEMLDNGRLLREVEESMAIGLSPENLAAAGIGYAETLELRAGKIDLREAQNRIAQRTLRYAKSQRTWWRKDPQIHWLIRATADPRETLAPAMKIVAAAAAQPWSDIPLESRKTSGAE